jgi:circadian clock protein KaiC
MTKTISSSHAEDNGSEPTKTTMGVVGLDDILNGGLPANRVYLIEGQPGTGKTTISLQFLLEGARLGESGLYITLSESKEELEAVAKSHGWSLDGFAVYELVPPEESLRPESQYTIFHPAEIELGETTSAVLEEVERTKPRRVVFDSLSEMRLLAINPLRFRRQILALKQYFAGRHSTVLLLDDKIYGEQDLQVHSIVHGVLSLEHLAVDYGSERRRLRVTKLRGTNFRGGYHDFTIETGGAVTFPRLVAAEHHVAFKRESLTSGITELDSLLGGGLDRGTSTLILGPAGSGKSTLAAQFAAAGAARGELTATFVFDELKETFIARAANTGLDLRGFMNADLFTIQQVDPAELSPGQFVHTVRDSVDRNNAKIVIIDSLNGYLNAMPNERFLTIQMHELLTYLNQRGVATIMVIAQHGFLGSSIETPVDVSYLADTVMMLRYFETAGAVRHAISVIKKRSGPHEHTIRELNITSEGIRIGNPLSQFRGVLTGLPIYEGA